MYYQFIALLICARGVNRTHLLFRDCFLGSWVTQFPTLAAHTGICIRIDSLATNYPTVGLCGLDRYVTCIRINGFGIRYSPI